MATSCRKPECTIEQTGICLLNNDPLQCPERQGLGTAGGDLASITVPPPLEAPERNPQFPNSLTLVPQRVSAILKGRSLKLIGILGSPDAGKTAVLVSLYLLLATSNLEGYRFSDSATMMAFDEISRGARRWNEGAPPAQMTSHTELADDRTAGFLHLRIMENETNEKFDLLLPDLPGEWTTSLIDTDRIDRWSFLFSADVIWITVDGRALRNSSSRQIVLHRTVLLMQRVRDFLAPQLPEVLLVISHRDGGEPSSQSVQKLESEAVRLGLKMRIVSLASFSDNDEVKPGTGVAELLKASMTSRGVESEATLWPEGGAAMPERQYGRFRANGGLL